MNIKNFLWVAPFLSFIVGYFMMNTWFSISQTTAPALVGKQIHAILPIITQHNLNIRLLDQKEEADLPEGIILNQTPAAGTTIKQNQPIFVVTTKKPSVTHAAHYVGLPLLEITQQLQTQGIRPRIYHLSHPYPENMCFAQSPQHHEPLEKNRITLYISSGNKKPIIWPDFTHVPLQDVIDLLDMYHIEPHIITDNTNMFYAQDNYVVIDQRPFAGTLLTLDENKPLSVQLRCAPIRK